MKKYIYIQIFLLALVITGFGRTYQDDIRMMEYIRMGDDAYQNENYEVAKDQYLNAIFLGFKDTDDFKFNFKLGRIYYETGNYDKSISYFQNADTFDHNIDDYIGLFLAKNFIGIGETNRAIGILESILIRMPHTRLENEIQSILAELYEKILDWETASHYWYMLSTKNINKGQRPQYWMKIAQNHFRLGSNDKALTYLLRSLESRSLRKHEQSLASFYLLVSFRDSIDMNLTEEEMLDGIATLTEHKLYDQAFHWINTYQKIYSDSAPDGTSYFMLGKLFYKKHSYYSAILNFRKLIDYYPGSRHLAEAQLSIARSRYRQGQINNAIVEYLKYVEKFPEASKASEVLWQVGWLLERRKENTKAAKMYSRLYSEYPGSKYRNDAKWREGFCYFKATRYSRARAIFQYVIKNFANSTNLKDKSTFWIGKSYEREGDIRNAQIIFKSLLNDPTQNYYRILCYNRWGTKKIKKGDLQLSSSRQSLGVSRTEIEDVTLQKVLTLYELLEESYSIQEIKGFASRHFKNPVKLKQMLWVSEQLGFYKHALKASFKLSNITTGSDSTAQLMHRYPTYYSKFVTVFANMYGIDPYLIYGIIKQESLFEKTALSWVGAMGVMQIMPYSAEPLAKKLGMKEFTKEDLFKPEVNILLGMQHLIDDLHRFNNRQELAVAAYNAGHGAVKRWMDWHGTRSMDEFIENIRYSQTRDYVKKVMHNYWIYKLIYE